MPNILKRYSDRGFIPPSRCPEFVDNTYNLTGIAEKVVSYRQSNTIQ